jgi:hypothetical protein
MPLTDVLLMDNPASLGPRCPFDPKLPESESVTTLGSGDCVQTVTT